MPIFWDFAIKICTLLATKHINHVLQFGVNKCFIGLKIAIFVVGPKVRALTTKNGNFEPYEAPNFNTWLMCLVDSRVQIFMAKSQKMGILCQFFVFLAQNYFFLPKNSNGWENSVVTFSSLQ